MRPQDESPRIARPNCEACERSHDPSQCCCGQPARDMPSNTPGKVLRECKQGLCHFAKETMDDQLWTYSFEAEMRSCAKRDANNAPTACRGIVSSVVESLATAMPYFLQRTTLSYVQALSIHASSRPVFYSLFTNASDKSACVQKLAPCIYEGTGQGIRSGFCSNSSSAGQCIPCHLLEQHAKTIYLSRAKTKTDSTLQTARSIMNPQARLPLPSDKVPLTTLTSLELRQRAAILSAQRRTDNQKALRAAQVLQDLKAQVKSFEAKLGQEQGELPELVKLFKMVVESGKPRFSGRPSTCNICPTAHVLPCASLKCDSMKAVHGLCSKLCRLVKVKVEWHCSNPAYIRTLHIWIYSIYSHI